MDGPGFAIVGPEVWGMHAVVLRLVKFSEDIWYAKVVHEIENKCREHLGIET